MFRFKKKHSNILFLIKHKFTMRKNRLFIKENIQVKYNKMDKIQNG